MTRDVLAGGYWPFWLGGMSLCMIAATYLLLLRRPLGVSGFVSRLVAKGEQDAAVEAERALDDHGRMLAELKAETLAEFGAAALPDCDAPVSTSTDCDAAATDTGGRPREQAQRAWPWWTSVVFLSSLALGGFIATVVRGAYEPRLTLSPEYRNLFGDGVAAWILLFTAGVGVGFGTRMAGGCTSGHGLVGCASLRPGSLLATAVFFGIAIALSLSLGEGA